MPTIVVSDGGTYSTLDAGIGAAADGDTISIEGTWNNDDTQWVNIDVANITIVADGDSKHPGYIEATGTDVGHYRLVTSWQECIEVAAAGASINDIVIINTGTSGSEEGIDYQQQSVDVDSCVIHSTNTTADKDGIYTSNTGRTLNATNTVITGFGRGGIHVQNHSGGSGNHNVNVDSCTIYKCGTDGATDCGGISLREVGTTVVATVDNTIVLDCNSGSSRDYRTYSTGTNIPWAVNYCVDSDNTIATVTAAAGGSGDNNLASHNITDDNTKAADGDWIIVENSQTAPYDLRLQSNIYNEALDTGATTLGFDIIGTARPQESIKAGGAVDDRGAFEWVAAATVSMATIQHYRHFIGGM